MANLILSPDQQNALTAFIDFLNDAKAKYLIIQGAAGCGKSTLITYLMKALEAQYQMYALLLQTNKKKEKFEVCISATTNQAVSVLEELTGRKASTIQSLLGLKVINNTRNGKTELLRKKDWKPLYNKLFIVDEASMVDNNLLKQIDRTAQDSKVVLMGDEWQLAPVGQETATMATLNCKKVVMNKILRNSGAIMKTGAQFREAAETGNFKPINKDPKIQQVDGPTFQQLVDNAFTDPQYKTNSIKILAWTNDRVQAYNKHIRKIKGYDELLQVGESAVTNKAIMSRNLVFKTDSFVKITNVGPEEERSDILGRHIVINNSLAGFLPHDPKEVTKLLKSLLVVVL